MRTSRSSSVSSTSSCEEETIQIFVKTIAGSTIPLQIPASTTVATLATILSLRTNSPPSDLRLLFAGKHLDSSATLAASSIKPESTIHLAFPIRGGMPAKLPKCDFKKDDPEKKCKEKIQPFVGACSFCPGTFCNKHRHLESHQCTGLEDCKKESHERNADKLNSERTTAIRGV